MSEATLVEIYRAENGVDAHIIRAALADAGIPAHITEQSVAALEPNIWWAAPKIFVAQVDASKAATILAGIEAARKARSAHLPAN
jgi:hypothetical protein